MISSRTTAEASAGASLVPRDRPSHSNPLLASSVALGLTSGYDFCLVDATDPQQTPYDAAFFSAQADGSRRSADVIVPIIVDLLHPQSVVDVGCGVGTWAASFAATGVKQVIGVEGAYVVGQQLQIDPACYVAADLTKPFSLDKHFDLAVSLEVAEHLPPERGRSFVADLVRLAPAILFSAAIPGQRGTHHVNEQWQEYWASLFAEHGLIPVDVVRPKVWNDKRVEWSYAQNTFLYLTVERASDFPTPDLVSVVHPGVMERTTEDLLAAQQRKLGTREILTGFPGAVSRSLGRRLWSARRS